MRLHFSLTTILEIVLFVWNVGVGHSTGCGFGALY